MKFREAVSRAGTLYLAKGENGAIYGALTFINIMNRPGLNKFGPGETLMFSVTNQKIYNDVTTKGPSIMAQFYKKTAIMGFKDGNENFGIYFTVDDHCWEGECET